MVYVYVLVMPISLQSSLRPRFSPRLKCYLYAVTSSRRRCDRAMLEKDLKKDLCLKKVFLWQFIYIFLLVIQAKNAKTRYMSKYKREF